MKVRFAVSVAVMALVALAPPAAAQDIYFIVSGPGAGVTIFARFRSAIPSLNPSTRAAGTIANPDACGRLHFHGSLFDLSDPHPQGCGWGEVVDPSEDGTFALIGLADASAHLLRAADAIDAGNFSEADVQARAAQRELQALDGFLREADIPEVVKRELQWQVSLTLGIIERTIETLESRRLELPIFRRSTVGPLKNLRQSIVGPFVPGKKLQWGQFSAMHHLTLVLHGLTKANLVRRR